MAIKKYFVAIIIPNPLQEKIEEIKSDLFKKNGLKGALRSPSHITLHRPFEWKEEKEAELIKKLSAFNFDQKFDVVLEGFSSFAPRVIYVDVLQNEMLMQLQGKLKLFMQKELKLLNEVNDERGFHPHVTVAFRDLKKNRFTEIFNEVQLCAIAGTFQYSGFSLLKLEKKWEEHHVFKNIL